MCPPTYFNVDYDINPWMTKQLHNVDTVLANKQWKALFNALKKVAQIIVLDPIPNLPDMVFTANAGTIVGNSAVLSNFRHSERKGEEPYFKQWFENHGYTVEQPESDYEGEGDHLVDSQGRHWIGWGWRTQLQATKQVSEILDTELNVLWLADARWYHLDTCFCPLTNGEVLWYPNAFLPKSRDVVINSFDVTIEASEEAALDFCCNAVVVGNDIFMPKNKEIARKLTKLGYTAHEFDLSEFIKAGGAAKCLVLKCGLAPTN